MSNELAQDESLLREFVTESDEQLQHVEQDLLALALAWKAPIPPDPDKDPASSHSPLLVSAFRSERPGEWPARLEVFELMLLRLQDKRADSQRTLAEMRDLLAVLSDVRASSTREQGKLEGIDAKGREGRQRFGFAVDALGLDASRARDELRAARIDFDRLAHQAKRAAATYAAAVRQVVTWEGRSGVEEPYPQLADAYRKCAEAVDAWIAARRIEQSARGTLEDKERTVIDLDYQIAELRGALGAHEQATDREHEAVRELVVELNGRAEQVETRLVELATRFCEPLRARPELLPLFRRLESGTIAPP